MVNEPPTEEVIKMKKEDKEHDDIIKTLEEKGYNQQQIVEAMNQAEIKNGVETKNSSVENKTPSRPMQESMLTSSPPEKSEEDIPVPIPSRLQEVAPKASSIQQVPQFTPPQYNYEDVQEIIESVVNEKWQQLITGVGDLSIWKSKTEDDISAIKQEILRFEERIDNLQRSIIGRVDEYNKNISKINTEMQALERVFEKIAQPFTENVKELSRLTRDLKENTSKTKNIIRKK